jgi:hypothetical protein
LGIRKDFFRSGSGFVVLFGSRSRAGSSDFGSRLASKGVLDTSLYPVKKTKSKIIQIFQSLNAALFSGLEKLNLDPDSNPDPKFNNGAGFRI